MIHIYKQPTEKDPTIGFYFLYFATESFSVMFKKTKEEFEIIKKELLSSNLEAFREFCEKTITEESITFSESANQVREIVNSNLDSKNGFENMKKAILDDTSCLKTMIKSIKPDKKQAAVFMATTIVKFLKEEK